jgi:hypothetical protein
MTEQQYVWRRLRGGVVLHAWPVGLTLAARDRSVRSACGTFSADRVADHDAGDVLRRDCRYCRSAIASRHIPS